MNKCFKDVSDFMRIGQPEMVAQELRAPDGVEAFSLRQLSMEMLTASTQLRIAPGPHPTRLGLGLILEELGEVIQAALEGDLSEFADGLGDLVYVTVGTAVAHGINLPVVWDEIQRSNMEKFPVCGTCEGSGWTVQHAGEQEYTTRCDACSGLGRVVIRDASGKVQKPSGWTPPDIKGVITRQSAP